MDNQDPIQCRRAFRGSYVLVVIFAMLTLGGCYKHVIRADGAAGDFYEVRKPNYRPGEPTIIDKLLSGDLGNGSTDD